MGVSSGGGHTNRRRGIADAEQRAIEDG